MAQLDADDVDRIERLDFELLRKRMAALLTLPMAVGSAEARFVSGVCRRRAIELTPEERHQVAVLCWAWRRRTLPDGLAPKVNPADPLSPELLARQMRCTPILAMARLETASP